jgi:hypothetical protein
MSVRYSAQPISATAFVDAGFITWQRLKFSTALWRNFQTYPIAVFIFKHLGTVFSHHCGYINIKPLADLVAYIAKSTGGQCAPINPDRLNYIRIIDFFQGGTDMPLLSAFISAGFWIGFPFPVWISGWQLAAVPDLRHLRLY